MLLVVTVQGEEHHHHSDGDDGQDEDGRSGLMAGGSNAGYVPDALLLTAPSCASGPRTCRPVPHSVGPRMRCERLAARVVRGGATTAGP